MCSRYDGSLLNGTHRGELGRGQLHAVTRWLGGAVLAVAQAALPGILTYTALLLGRADQEAPA
jgi:hypothetical protein